MAGDSDLLTVKGELHRPAHSRAQSPRFVREAWMTPDPASIPATMGSEP